MQTEKEKFYDKVSKYSDKGVDFIIAQNDEIKLNIDKIALAYKHVEDLAKFLATKPVQFLFQRMKAKDYQTKCNKAIEVLFSHLSAQRKMLEGQKQELKKIEKFNNLCEQYEKINNTLNTFRANREQGWLDHFFQNCYGLFAEDIEKAFELGKLVTTSTRNDSYKESLAQVEQNLMIDMETKCIGESILEKVKRTPSNVITNLYQAVSSFKKLEKNYQDLIKNPSAQTSKLITLHDAIKSEIEEFRQNSYYQLCEATFDSILAIRQYFAN